MSVYRIKDWAKHYENNRTKGMAVMRWVPIPNTHDGEGYTQMVAGEGDIGAAVLGAWVAAVQVASRCHPRGTLLRKGDVPHDAASLASRTRLSVSAFEEMIKRATLPSVGWMEVVEMSDVIQECQAPAETPQAPAETRHPTAMEGRKEGRKEGIDARAPQGGAGGDVTGETSRGVALETAVAMLWPNLLAGDPKKLQAIVKDFEMIGATAASLKAVKAKADKVWTSPGGPDAILKHWATLQPAKTAEPSVNYHQAQDADKIYAALEADRKAKEAYAAKNGVKLAPPGDVNVSEVPSKKKTPK